MPAAVSDVHPLLGWNRDYEALVAAVLYLMRRYLHTGNRHLGEAITAHLAALAEHPHCPNVCLARTARQLDEEWTTLKNRYAAGEPGGLP